MDNTANSLANKPPRKRRKTVKAGRRTDQERATGRWRLTIREVKESKGEYKWTTFLCQGWRENGRWCRKRFRDRDTAEKFIAVKRLEVDARGSAALPVLTRLTERQVHDAEIAAGKLAELAAENAAGGRTPTLTEAVEHFAKHWRLSVAVQAVSFSDARAAIVADKKEKGRRVASVRSLDINLGAFQRWLCSVPRYNEASIDARWTPPVHEITREDVEDYLNQLRNRKGSAAATGTTRNNLRADLSIFFDWCQGIQNGLPIKGVHRKWCTANPVANIPKAESVTTPPQILSVAAARSLMAHVETCRPELVQFYGLALFAGLRPGADGELYKLAAHPELRKPCEDAAGRPLLDMERGILTVPASIAKTGRRRIITIQPNLKQWLSCYTGDILPAGVHWKTQKVRTHCKLSPDVARHSFISFFVGLTGSKARAALEAGNSEAMIDRHYLHIPTEAEAREFFSIIPTAKAPKKK